jgi:hypothetical protein
MRKPGSSDGMDRDSYEPDGDRPKKALKGFPKKSVGRNDYGY